MDRLARENTLLRGVCEQLVAASTRSDVERGVCEAVAAVDGIGFAWVGARRMTDDAVVPRASAGLDVNERGDVLADDGPVTRALADREPVVVSGDDCDPGVREDATDRSFERAAAVPLLSNGALHGVLVAYAADAAALADEFVDVLVDLGNLVAAALASVERRRRLYAGRLVELDLRVTDYDAFPYDASRALDCRIDLEGFTAEREGFLVYFDVTGPDASPDAIRRVTDAETVSVLDTAGDACTVAVERPPESVLGALADVGATLADATVADGTADLTVRLAPDAAIPAVLDRLDAIAPDVTVVSKRETAREFGRTTGVLDSLTDRQHTVLTAAYHAGYFDWPRRTNGEELADSLDVSPPTFYQHLRAAERNAFAELLDGE